MAGIKTMKFKVGAGAAKKEAGSTGYTGPIPPTGSYRTTVKRVMIGQNAAGPVLIVLAEITEPKGSSNAKYNGYGFWCRQNITDQGAGYVNQLIRAFAGDDGDEAVESFWEDGPKVKEHEKKDRNGNPQFHVKKIGELNINSPEVKGLEMIVAGKYEKSKQWGERCEAQSYAPISSWEDTASDDVDDDDDDDEEPVVTTKKKLKVAKPPVEEDDDDDEDDVSDDPTDYDEDEEPEKVKAAKSKRAARVEEDEDEDDTSDDDDEDDEDGDDEPPF